MSDGTNSKVWYTPDITAALPAWAATGTPFAGVYTLVRTTNTPGSVMVYAPLGADPTTVNFTYGLGSGPASATVGESITMTSSFYTADIDYLIVRADANVRFEITAEDNWNPYTGGGEDRVDYTLADGTFVAHDGASGFNPIDLPSSTELRSSVLPETPTFQCATHYSSGHVVLHITILSIGGVSTDAVVRLSTDNGATVGSPVIVGISPGVAGGFDVQKAGSVNYAACAEKVRKATTLGGAFSDHTAYTGANPVCVIIPWGRWGSGTSNNISVSDPDYLVALDSADSGGGTLYKVDGATAGKTDITPVAGMTFNSASCATCWNGKHIAVIGQVSGVDKVYVSRDAGATWTLCGTVADAVHIMVRRLASTPGEFTAAGASLEYTTTFGSALTNKNLPSASDLLFFILLG